MRTLMRLVLLRLLPGRLLPILTVYEVIRVVRRLRRNRAAAGRERAGRDRSTRGRDQHEP